MDWKDRKALVVGMARSGIAAAQLLLELGAEVMLYDQKPAECFALGELLENCRDLLGKDPMYGVEWSDMLVLSPGVPTRLDFIQKACAMGKPVISEIELGYLAAQADFVCISGTNGKTTTTALTGEIFKAAGRHTFVLGNIGIPICEKARETAAGDVIVAEVAALQLETIDAFRPRAAALLNITEDHMDRFGTMEYYTHCKMRMFENQGPEDFAILNRDSESVREQAAHISSRVLWFSRQQEVENGAFVRAGQIIFRMDGVEQVICPAEAVRIPGGHNLENALAAVCLAMVMGVEAKVVAETLQTFPGVEHRIEFVRTVGGVTYINDSKGTNPDATIKAIEAMRSPTVLILGGYDKNSEFDELFATFTENIVGISVLGATREKIIAAAKRAGFSGITVSDTFEEAVRAASAAAPEGGCVLLSPACASWDMFDNFEQRGRVFKEIVAGL